MSYDLYCHTAAFVGKNKWRPKVVATTFKLSADDLFSVQIIPDHTFDVDVLDLKKPMEVTSFFKRTVEAILFSNRQQRKSLENADEDVLPAVTLYSGIGGLSYNWRSETVALGAEKFVASLSPQDLDELKNLCRQKSIVAGYFDLGLDEEKVAIARFEDDPEVNRELLKEYNDVSKKGKIPQFIFDLARQKAELIVDLALKRDETVPYFVNKPEGVEPENADRAAPFYCFETWAPSLQEYFRKCVRNEIGKKLGYRQNCYVKPTNEHSSRFLLNAGQAVLWDQHDIIEGQMKKDPRSLMSQDSGDFNQIVLSILNIPTGP